MKPLGIFGGTFDPPHCSHAMALLWALQSGEVDRVLVIPAARHPFGKDPGASYDDRLEMCRLMAAELYWHEVNELRRRLEEFPHFDARFFAQLEERLAFELNQLGYRSRFGYRAAA